MGICSSCDATAVAKLTAKVVLPDGKLQEFDRPVSVSKLVQGEPTCFVCNADDMEFDEFVTELDHEEELQLGQLYFLLPSYMLTRKLDAAEMAALAIRASSALTNATSFAPLQFPMAEQRTRRAHHDRTRRPRGGKGRKFTSGTSPILE